MLNLLQVMFLPLITTLFLACSDNPSNQIKPHSNFRASIPQNSSTLPANASFIINFSQEVLSETISNSSIYIVDTNNTKVTLSLQQDTLFVKITPQNYLDINKTYTLVATTALKSSDGVALSKEMRWSFTTTSYDITPPILNTMLPNNGMTNVDPNGVIILEFNELIDTTNLPTDALEVVDENNTVVKGSLEHKDSWIWFTPTNTLDTNKTYTIQLNTTLKDLSKNSFIKTDDWHFTTATKELSSDGFSKVSDDLALQKESYALYVEDNETLYVGGDNAIYKVTTTREDSTPKLQKIKEKLTSTLGIVYDIQPINLNNSCTNTNNLALATSKGLSIVDANSLEIVAQKDFQTEFFSVALHCNEDNNHTYAYIAKDGINVIDINDTQHLILMQSKDLNKTLFDLHIKDAKLYTTAYKDGIVIYDLDLNELQQTDTYARTRSLEFDNNTLVLSNGVGGVNLYKLEDTTLTQEKNISSLTTVIKTYTTQENIFAITTTKGISVIDKNDTSKIAYQIQSSKRFINAGADSEFLYTLSLDGTLSVYNLTSTKENGKAVDGYLMGAKAYKDCNNNEVYDEEIDALSITDSLGSYSFTTLPYSCKDATLIVEGGVDKDTNVTFQGSLKAQAKSKNISPLTSLITVDATLQETLKNELNLTSVDSDFVQEKNSNAMKLALSLTNTLSLLINTTGKEHSLDINEKFLSKITASFKQDSTALSNQSDMAELIASLATNTLKDFADQNESLSFSSDDLANMKNSMKEMLNTIQESVTSECDVNGSAIGSVFENSMGNMAQRMMKIQKVESAFFNTTFEIAENQTSFMLQKINPETNQSISLYELVSGVDKDMFEINTTSGELYFKNAQDYEIPNSANGTNTYKIDIQITDENNATSEQNLTIKLQDVDEAPIFITTTTNFTLHENIKFITTLQAEDPERTTLKYSIDSGVDKDLFEVNTTSGELNFINAPDYEQPKSSLNSNIYKIDVNVSDEGNNSSLISLEIEVENIPTTFTQENIITEFDHYRSVYSIDMDGDGDVDILSAAEQALVWYENNQTNNFIIHTISKDINQAQSVYAIDMDGDGDIDVLSALVVDDKIAWYENDGHSNFIDHTITTDADSATDVYAIDIDGDGDIDVLSASSYDDKIAWYENDGSCNFTDHNITTNADQAHSVYAIDMDGDGDIDVLSASSRDDKIAWYENDGNSTFTDHNITTDADFATDVYAIDMDGDGDIDVLSASSSDDTIAWYENDGSSNFTAHAIATDADSVRSIYAKDMDGDGDIDVIGAMWDDDRIAWYENDGTNNFTDHTITIEADGAYDVYAIDIDGDDDIDVISASYLDNKIAWYENDGTNNFLQKEIVLGCKDPESTFAIDIDGDGDIDVLSASSYKDKILWYENDGNNSFTDHIITTDADFAVDVYAIDMDGDGDIDVLSASRSDDKVAWYENDGSSNFTDHIITTDADYIQSVYAIDIDGDGDIDVLSASASDDKIAWYENNGSNGYTEHNITLDADYATDVYAIDIDKDGDIDVLSSSKNDDKIAWYENDGNSTFTTNIITTDADGAYSVYAIDIDKDGDIDILGALYDDDKIVWYENDGSNDFTAHNVATNVQEIKSVYAQDMDGDGDIDILGTSYANDRIVWYENNGENSFREHIVSVKSDGINSIYAIDIDRDGKMDILGSSENDSKISWYKNEEKAQ